MSVNTNTYYIGVILIVILVAGLTYLISKKRKNKKIGSIGLLLAILVFVFNRWIFPAVYIVPQCGTVQKQVMIIPFTASTGTHIAYGRHCYLINESAARVLIETIFYGNARLKETDAKFIDEALPPKTGKAYKPTVLDYFFEKPDKSVTTNAGGEIKYVVSCSAQKQP